MTDQVLIAAAGLAGLLAGGLGGYVLSLRRARVVVAGELARARQRAEQAARAARAEVAAELEEKDQTIASLEARIEEERQKAEQTHSRLQADLAHLEGERGRLQARAHDLGQRVEQMRAELRQLGDEGMRELEDLHEIANALGQAIQRIESRLLAADRRVKESVKAAVTAPKS